MPYLYLILSIALMASGGILARFFQEKTNGSKNYIEFYNVLISLSVFASWLILLLFDHSFDVRVLPYSVLFGAAFSLANIFRMKAIKIGSLSLTSLFLQFSLIGVTVYGIVFGWPNAKLNFLVVIGLLLVITSIFMCFYKKGDTSVNLKWVIYVFIMFASNAACTIVQKEQQLRFDGMHGTSFMTIASFIFLAYSVFVYLKREKSDNSKNIKYSFFPVMAGVFNFGLNFCMIMLAQQSLISSSVVYPVVAVGGLILSVVFSACIFREKLDRFKWIGIVLGAIAVAILNI